MTGCLVRRAAVIAAAALLAGCATSHPAPLVVVEAHPARPMLHAGADTNDPLEYYEYGRARLFRAPDSAAAAFWWAARLDPWWAAPVYGRAVALLADRNYSYRARMRGDRPEPARDDYVMAAVDSLARRSIALEPFLVHDLDYVLSGRTPPSAIARMRDPAEAGYAAFTNGDYERAITLLGKALAAHAGGVSERIVRAQAFYQLSSYDSAANELTRALDTLTARDTSRRFFGTYQSKEILYYALGTVQSARNDTAAARAAFDQALVENLGFTMARVRLAGVALMEADTADALGELDAALLATPEDAALHYFYGTLLSAAGRTGPAIDHLLRAAGLDPDFAAPHVALGRIAEAIGEREEAADEYASYLQHAAVRLADRKWVEERLEALRRAP